MEIEKRILTPLAGFSGELAHYLGGLAQARRRLRETVGDLSLEELSARVFPNAHQIGNLVLHIGEAEASWIHSRITGRELTGEEKSFPHVYDTTERDYAEKGYSAAECLERIDQISQKSRAILADFTDDDLDKTFGYETDDNRKAEGSLRRVLVDQLDHEAVHRGQISMLKRILRGGEI
jgi:uncharacterized damage-inducible protein DinB